MNLSSIERDRDEVYSFLADGLNNNPKWRPGVKNIALESGSAFGTFEPVVWQPDEEARKVCAQTVTEALGSKAAVDVEVVIRQGPAA